MLFTNILKNGTLIIICILISVLIMYYGPLFSLRFVSRERKIYEYDTPSNYYVQALKNIISLYLKHLFHNNICADQMAAYMLEKY